MNGLAFEQAHLSAAKTLPQLSKVSQAREPGLEVTRSPLSQTLRGRGRGGGGATVLVSQKNVSH